MSQKHHQLKHIPVKIGLRLALSLDQQLDAEKKQQQQRKFMKTPNMKSILQAAIITVFTFTFVQAANAKSNAQTTKEVNISISDAYVPGGFDSDADSYVVVNGLYPNGCYRWLRSEIVDQDAFNHEIRAIASVSQGLCVMVLVPFNHDVRLGKLATGNHTLKFVNGDGTYLQKTLTIE